MMDVSLREYIERVIEERERTHAAQREAVERALAEAEVTLNRRLGEMNEFRKQIQDERGTYVHKDNLQMHVDASDERIRKLEDMSSNYQGRFWSLGIGLALLTALLNIAFHFV